MQLLVLLLILPILGTNCELTESVIFQPVDDIQTNKSSWIFSTAVDFTPYLRSLRSVFSYGRNVKETVVAFKGTFYRQHPRYMELLNITVDDLNLALDEILHMQTEASNLIDHLTDRHKRSLLPFGGLFSFLFGTADQNDIKILNNYIKIRWIKQMFLMM